MNDDDVQKAALGLLRLSPTSQHPPNLLSGGAGLGRGLIGRSISGGPVNDLREGVGATTPIVPLKRKQHPNSSSSRQASTSSGTGSGTREGDDVEILNSEGESGEDTIKCICSIPLDDGWSIGCDGCGRWCHGICFGIDVKDKENLPDRWLCWICEPREVDRERAERIVRARLGLPPPGSSTNGDGFALSGDRDVEMNGFNQRRRATTALEDIDTGMSSHQRRRTSPGVERKPRKPSSASAASGDKRRRRMSLANSPVVSSHPPLSSGSASGSNHVHFSSTAHPNSSHGGRKDNLGHTNSHSAEENVEWDPEDSYVDIQNDIVPHEETREKLRTMAGCWRGVTALNQPTGSIPSPSHLQIPNPWPPPPNPYLDTTPLVLPNSTQQRAQVRPLPQSYPSTLLPQFALHTTDSIPPHHMITPYPSMIIPSSAYLEDPLNAYAHLGTAKPYVRLFGPPLDLALDARNAGGKGRWARRGCWPNAVVRPYLCGETQGDDDGSERGKQEDSKQEMLKFGIFALRDLKADEEVVLGWEWDDEGVIHSLASELPPATPQFRVQMQNILHNLSSTFTTCACSSTLKKGKEGVNGGIKGCALRRMEEWIRKCEIAEKQEHQARQREWERQMQIHVYPHYPVHQEEWASPGSGPSRLPDNSHLPPHSRPHPAWHSPITPHPPQLPANSPYGPPNTNSLHLPHIPSVPHPPHNHSPQMSSNSPLSNENDHSNPSTVSGRKVDLGPLIGPSNHRGFRTRERIPGSGGLGGCEMVPENEEGQPSLSRSPREIQDEEHRRENEADLDVEMEEPQTPRFQESFVRGQVSSPSPHRPASTSFLPPLRTAPSGMNGFGVVSPSPHVPNLRLPNFVVSPPTPKKANIWGEKKQERDSQSGEMKGKGKAADDEGDEGEGSEDKLGSTVDRTASGEASAIRSSSDAFERKRPPKMRKRARDVDKTMDVVGRGSGSVDVRDTNGIEVDPHQDSQTMMPPPPMPASEDPTTVTSISTPVLRKNSLSPLPLTFLKSPPHTTSRKHVPESNKPNKATVFEERTSSHSPQPTTSLPTVHPSKSPITPEEVLPVLPPSKSKLSPVNSTELSELSERPASEAPVPPSTPSTDFANMSLMSPHSPIASKDYHFPPSTSISPASPSPPARTPTSSEGHGTPLPPARDRSLSPQGEEPSERQEHSESPVHDWEPITRNEFAVDKEVKLEALEDVEMADGQHHTDEEPTKDMEIDSHPHSSVDQNVSGADSVGQNQSTAETTQAQPEPDSQLDSTESDSPSAQTQTRAATPPLPQTPEPAKVKMSLKDFAARRKQLKAKEEEEKAKAREQEVVNEEKEEKEPVTLTEHIEEKGATQPSGSSAGTEKASNSLSKPIDFSSQTSTIEADNLVVPASPSSSVSPESTVTTVPVDEVNGDRSTGTQSPPPTLNSHHDSPLSSPPLPQILALANGLLASPAISLNLQSKLLNGHSSRPSAIPPVPNPIPIPPVKSSIQSIQPLSPVSSQHHTPTPPLPASTSSSLRLNGSKAHSPRRTASPHPLPSNPASTASPILPAPSSQIKAPSLIHRLPPRPQTPELGEIDDPPFTPSYPQHNSSFINGRKVSPFPFNKAPITPNIPPKQPRSFSQSPVVPRASPPPTKTPLNVNGNGIGNGTSYPVPLTRPRSPPKAPRAFREQQREKELGYREGNPGFGYGRDPPAFGGGGRRDSRDWDRDRDRDRDYYRGSLREGQREGTRSRDWR